jgi:predicted nucleic acid-binding protein
VNAVKLKDNYISGAVELSTLFLAVEEVANAFLRAVRLERISEIDAGEALEALGDLGVELHQLNWSHVAQVLGVARGLGLTVYDASYVYYAEELKATLITADDTLYERAGKRCNVLHIKDY